MSRARIASLSWSVKVAARTNCNPGVSMNLTLRGSLPGIVITTSRAFVVVYGPLADAAVCVSYIENTPEPRIELITADLPA